MSKTTEQGMRDAFQRMAEILELAKEAACTSRQVRGVGELHDPNIGSSDERRQAFTEYGSQRHALILRRSTLYTVVTMLKLPSYYSHSIGAFREELTSTWVLLDGMFHCLRPRPKS
jgi:hypothetical protein